MAQRNLWDQVDGNLYEILGVDESAAKTEIVAAWRITAKQHHPDLGGSAETFAQAEVAYQVLSDPLERGRYDRWLAASRATSQQSYYYQPGYSRHSQSRTQTRYATFTYQQPRADSAYRQPEPMKPVNLWRLLVIALIIVAVIIGALVFAITVPLLVIGGLIWVIGRFLNPRESRGP